MDREDRLDRVMMTIGCKKIRVIQKIGEMLEIEKAFYYSCAHHFIILHLAD